MTVLLNEPGFGALTWEDIPGSASQIRALFAISRSDRVRSGRRLAMTMDGLTVPASTLAALSRRSLIVVNNNKAEIAPLGKLAVAWISAADLVGN